MIRDAWIRWSSMDPPPLAYPVRSALGSFRTEGRKGLRIRFAGINSRISIGIDDYGEFWLEVALADATAGRKRVQRVDQIFGYPGQRRRSRVTHRFLERFVFPEIAALVNRIDVVDHAVIMDTGWILCSRNAPESGAPVFVSWRDHTWQRFNPHCDQFDDTWRFYCEDFFDLSHAIEFIPVHRPMLRSTTPYVATLP
jgi:hypothetical protein